MNINVNISSSEVTKDEFAKVNLKCSGTNLKSVLDLQFSPLYKRCRIPSPVILDLLFFASIIYAIDKLVPRKIASDNWTRDINLNVPVSDPELWSQVTSQLETCLSFLTGDNWEMRFSDLQCNLYRPKIRRRRSRQARRCVRADAVCLFSGGLDSLIGAVNWMESNSEGSLLLVGHHDRYGGPMSDQRRLFQILEPQYNSRVELLQVRAGQKPAGEETTFRSRSLLFIALGIYVARSIGEQTSLLMPENGTIALNIPLTPSRRGSCSTRTAHPFFLDTIRQLLVELGIENSIHNPLKFRTKGECIEQCLNQTLLRSASLESVSCAKRGHKSIWFNRTAKGCGFCIPCIYRRAALHRIGMDVEKYGRDICRGEVDLDSDKELANDLRAVVSFLRRNVPTQDVASLLLANGSINLTDLPQYAELVTRAMDEIRTLLRDKGTEDIKQRVGITN